MQACPTLLLIDLLNQKTDPHICSWFSNKAWPWVCKITVMFNIQKPNIENRRSLFLKLKNQKMTFWSTFIDAFENVTSKLYIIPAGLKHWNLIWVVHFSRNLKGLIGSLFDPCVNAMRRRPCWRSCNNKQNLQSANWKTSVRFTIKLNYT